MSLYNDYIDYVKSNGHGKNGTVYSFTDYRNGQNKGNSGSLGATTETNNPTYTYSSGTTPTTQPATTVNTTPTPAEKYNIPTNLYPTTSSNSSSSSSSYSHSGINWDNPLNKAVLPSLTNAATGLQGKVDLMGTQLRDMYANDMRRAMNPNNFQGVLNSLSNRGMLNSSVAENALSKAGNIAARSIADKAFDANIAQTQRQLEVPSILSGIAQLGNESVSSSESNSSNTSSSSNPLAPYELMAQYMTT